MPISEKRREYAARYYWAHKEEVIKRNMACAKRNKTKTRARFKKYYQANQEKIVARRILNNRIKSGLVIRPKRCDACNVHCKSHAHHSDYSKPLEVVWLCRGCHWALHRKENV